MFGGEMDSFEINPSKYAFELSTNMKQTCSTYSNKFLTSLPVDYLALDSSIWSVIS